MNSCKCRPTIRPPAAVWPVLKADSHDCCPWRPLSFVLNRPVHINDGAQKAAAIVCSSGTTGVSKGARSGPPISVLGALLMLKSIRFRRRRVSQPCCAAGAHIKPNAHWRRRCGALLQLTVLADRARFVDHVRTLRLHAHHHNAAIHARVVHRQGREVQGEPIGARSMYV